MKWEKLNKQGINLPKCSLGQRGGGKHPTTLVSSDVINQSFAKCIGQ